MKLESVGTPDPDKVAKVGALLFLNILEKNPRSARTESGVTNGDPEDMATVDGEAVEIRRRSTG